MVATPTDLDTKKGPGPQAPEKPSYDLGQRLKFIRESRELSQTELAERAQVSQSTVAQIERGRMDPSVKTLGKITAAMQVDIATVFARGDVHIFDLQRLYTKYDDVEKLTPHLYMALGKVIQYAKDIRFLR